MSVALTVALLLLLSHWFIESQSVRQQELGRFALDGSGRLPKRNDDVVPLRDEDLQLFLNLLDVALQLGYSFREAVAHIAQVFDCPLSRLAEQPSEQILQMRLTSLQRKVVEDLYFAAEHGGDLRDALPRLARRLRAQKRLPVISLGAVFLIVILVLSYVLVFFSVMA